MTQTIQKDSQLTVTDGYVVVYNETTIGNLWDIIESDQSLPQIVRSRLNVSPNNSVVDEAIQLEQSIQSVYDEENEAYQTKTVHRPTGESILEIPIDSAQIENPQLFQVVDQSGETHPRIESQVSDDTPLHDLLDNLYVERDLSDTSEDWYLVTDLDVSVDPTQQSHLTSPEDVYQISDNILYHTVGSFVYGIVLASIVMTILSIVTAVLPSAVQSTILLCMIPLVITLTAKHLLDMPKIQNKYVNTTNRIGIV